jgi:hypothetical protein
VFRSLQHVKCRIFANSLSRISIQQWGRRSYRLGGKIDLYQQQMNIRIKTKNGIGKYVSSNLQRLFFKVKKVFGMAFLFLHPPDTLFLRIAAKRISAARFLNSAAVKRTYALRVGLTCREERPTLRPESALAKKQLTVLIFRVRQFYRCYHSIQCLRFMLHFLYAEVLNIASKMITCSICTCKSILLHTVHMCNFGFRGLSSWYTEGVPKFRQTFQLPSSG